MPDSIAASMVLPAGSAGKRLFIGLLWMASLCQGQRTPTISYITPSITTKIGGTIEMDCSVLYATEYPILWVKLPSHCSAARETYNLRAQESDSCTPVPLSSGSALIVRDNRFRYVKKFNPIKTSWRFLCTHIFSWNLRDQRKVQIFVRVWKPRVL